MACADRPELQRLREQMRKNAVLVLWRLDRLGRNLQDLLGFVNALDAQGIQFVSLTERMNTTIPTGHRVFQIFGALAEYERGLIRERPLTGQPPPGNDGGQAADGADPHAGPLALSITHICQAVGVSSTTLYRFLTPQGEQR